MALVPGSVDTACAPTSLLMFGFTSVDGVRIIRTADRRWRREHDHGAARWVQFLPQPSVRTPRHVWRRVDDWGPHRDGRDRWERRAAIPDLAIGTRSTYRAFHRGNPVWVS